MKVLYFILISTFLFNSCKQVSSGSSSQAASPNFQSGSCNIGKWNSGNLPLTISLSPDFASDFTNADLVGGLNPIEQMAKVWNDPLASSLSLFRLPFGTSSNRGSSSLSAYRDSEFGIYKSYNWFSTVSPNALAITQFYGVMKSSPSLGSYIDLTHADIILNYRDFGTQFSYNGNSFIDYNIPTVILHEMGHFLGLCHENTSPSIMAPYYLSTQKTLKTFDTNKIRALYINDQNISAKMIGAIPKVLNAPVGEEVQGVIELNANGICKHYINGKLVHQHK